MSGGSELGNMRATPSAPAPIEGDEPSLVMSILQRRKRFVLVTTGVCLLVTLVLTSTQTKIYSSTASAQAFPPPAPAGATPNMATEVQIARSSTVASAAAARLGLHVAPSELLSNLGVVVPADSDILDFTYSSPRPKDAQKGAQAFRDAYVAVREQQLQKSIGASATATAKQINDMQAQLSVVEQKLAGASGSERTKLLVRSGALATQLSSLQQKAAELNDQLVHSPPAGPAGDALLPTSPTKPKVALNLFLGVLGGLMIGFGIAALAEFLDDRLRSAKDLQGRLGVPVLGVIPPDTREAPGGTLVALGAPTSPAGDAFRRLSTNVAAAAAETGVRSIAVTGVDREDAPTELITNLAALLAASGKRVVLVSMARRWPSLEETFGAAPGPGFLDALAGTVPIRSALAATEVENLLLCRRGRADLIEIGTGRASEDRPRAVAIPSNAPSYALGSERTAELTADLGEPFDFVLVDAPALLGDADAAALSRACDAVLAVATPATTRSDVARAREQLDHVRATLLGGVLIERIERGERQERRPGKPIASRESVMDRIKLARVGHGRSSGR